MDTLQAAGIIPLAMGEQWTAMHLLETVLLATLGADAYNGLWDGSTDWASAEVTAGSGDFAKVLTYTNSDCRFPDLAGCCTAGCQWRCRLQRDGRLGRRLLPRTGQGPQDRLRLGSCSRHGWQLPVPVRQLRPAGGRSEPRCSHRLADRLPVPRKVRMPSTRSRVPSPPAATAIAACTACTCSPPWMTGPPTSWSASLTHGVVANDSWKTEIDTALGLFLADQDVEAFQTALVAACESLWPCATNLVPITGTDPQQGPSLSNLLIVPR